MSFLTTRRSAQQQNVCLPDSQSAGDQRGLMGGWENQRAKHKHTPCNWFSNVHLDDVPVSVQCNWSS